MENIHFTVMKNDYLIGKIKTFGISWLTIIDV